MKNLWLYIKAKVWQVKLEIWVKCPSTGASLKLTKTWFLARLAVAFNMGAEAS